jgi:hypothetical protein
MPLHDSRKAAGERWPWKAATHIGGPAGLTRGSAIRGLSGAEAVLATAWLATMASDGNAKSRPGITPCGLIRDCRFPSSVAVVISGEERKGSGLLRKDSATGARQTEPPSGYPQHIHRLKSGNLSDPTVTCCARIHRLPGRPTKPFSNRCEAVRK